MSRNAVESLMGVVVLAVAGGFAFFAYHSANMKQGDSYPLKARFENVDGIGTGSDVRIGGVKVGVVSKLELDPQSYMAVVEFGLRPDVQLPEDTSVAIVSAGLLGSKYVALNPGGSDSMLKPGAEISLTQSSVNLEEMIGKFMFSGEDKAENTDAGEADAGEEGAAASPDDSLGMGL